MTTKYYQLSKAWHVLKANGLHPFSVVEGQTGPLTAFKNFEDDVPAVIVAWNEQDECFGVLAAWPLQGVLLHQLNAVKDRRLDSVRRTPILPEVLAATAAAI